jgi:hypothetical protein
MSTRTGFQLPTAPAALIEVDRLQAADGPLTVTAWIDPVSVWHVVEIADDGRAWDTGPLAPRDRLPEAVTAAVDYATEKRRHLRGQARDPRGNARELHSYVLPPEELCHRLPAQGSLF